MLDQVGVLAADVAPAALLISEVGILVVSEGVLITKMSRYSARAMGCMGLGFTFIFLASFAPLR